jgi:hypothetical protein
MFFAPSRVAPTLCPIVCVLETSPSPTVSHGHVPGGRTAAGSSPALIHVDPIMIQPGFACHVGDISACLTTLGREPSDVDARQAAVDAVRDHGSPARVFMIGQSGLLNKTRPPCLYRAHLFKGDILRARHNENLSDKGPSSCLSHPRAPTGTQC